MTLAEVQQRAKAYAREAMLRLAERIADRCREPVQVEVDLDDLKRELAKFYESEIESAFFVGYGAGEVDSIAHGRRRGR